MLFSTACYRRARDKRLSMAKSSKQDLSRCSSPKSTILGREPSRTSESLHKFELLDSSRSLRITVQHELCNTFRPVTTLSRDNRRPVNCLRQTVTRSHKDLQSIIRPTSQCWAALAHSLHLYCLSNKSMASEQRHASADNVDLATRGLRPLDQGNHLTWTASCMILQNTFVADHGEETTLTPVLLHVVKECIMCRERVGAVHCAFPVLYATRGRIFPCVEHAPPCLASFRYLITGCPWPWPLLKQQERSCRQSCDVLICVNGHTVVRCLCETSLSLKSHGFFCTSSASKLHAFLHLLDHSNWRHALTFTHSVCQVDQSFCETLE